jgi:hypothetical protein
MLRFGKRAAIVLEFALLAASMTMAAAHASVSKRDQCSAGGDTMFGTVYYTLQTGGAWVDSVSFTIQDNVRKKNNVYLRLRGNGGSTTYWAWTSGDDIHGEQTYHFPVNEFVPRNADPYMKFHVIFDQDGSDPRCEFYVPLY